MTVVVRDGKLVDLGDGAKAWPLAGIARGNQMVVGTQKSLELIGLDLAASYAQIYSSQPWIYATVNKLSRNIARLPLRGYREDAATGSRAELRRAGDAPHPLPALLSRPYPRGSRFKLVEATIGSLALYGHALWWKFRPRPGQPPVELWPIDWRYVTIMVGEDVPIQHYIYRDPRATRPKVFFPDDVVHFEWWSPNGLRGTSPLEPLRTTLALEDAGRRYAVASFANGVRPSGALVSEKPVVGDARKELKAEIEAIHKNPDNAFRMMLLDAGLDWKPFAHTSQEAQTIEHRKLNREEAAAVYDIPPPMIQILDRATFSNIDEQHQMLYVDTFGPWFGMLEETIYAQLLWGERELGFALDPDDGEVEEAAVAFDLTEILRADIAKRATAYVQMRSSGAWTVDDTREAEGKPKFNTPASRSFLSPLNYDMHGADDEDETALEETVAARRASNPGPDLAALGDRLAAGAGGAA